MLKLAEALALERCRARSPPAKDFVQDEMNLVPIATLRGVALMDLTFGGGAGGDEGGAVGEWGDDWAATRSLYRRLQLDLEKDV